MFLIRSIEGARLRHRVRDGHQLMHLPTKVVSFRSLRLSSQHSASGHKVDKSKTPPNPIGGITFDVNFIIVEQKGTAATVYSEPARVSRELLFVAIAYRLQEQVLGGLRPELQRRLRSIAERVSRGEEPVLTAAPRLKPGTSRGTHPFDWSRFQPKLGWLAGR